LTEAHATDANAEATAATPADTNFERDSMENLLQDCESAI
jgi:hypothetical protein